MIDSCYECGHSKSDHEGGKCKCGCPVFIPPAMMDYAQDEEYEDEEEEE